jgi:hypothetical protein
MSESIYGVVFVGISLGNDDYELAEKYHSKLQKYCDKDTSSDDTTEIFEKALKKFPLLELLYTGYRFDQDSGREVNVCIKRLKLEIWDEVVQLKDFIFDLEVLPDEMIQMNEFMKLIGLTDVKPEIMMGAGYG